MKNKIIAIIGAMECEVELIKNSLDNKEKVSDTPAEIYTGNIYENKIVLAKSGVGKTASACCTQFIIDNFKPDFIINTGVAGGISSDLKIGDIVLADELLYHDFDATVLGYAKGYICNNINNDRPTIFYSDKTLNEQIENVIINVLGKSCFHRGLIASGDMFVGISNKKQEIKNEFNATAIEMEGASIAHTATLNNVPFTVIRAISDLADGQMTPDFAEFERKSAQISANIIKNFLHCNL